VKNEPFALVKNPLVKNQKSLKTKEIDFSPTGSGPAFFHQRKLFSQRDFMGEVVRVFRLRLFLNCGEPP
jgi:hypothetical protein